MDLEAFGTNFWVYFAIQKKSLQDLVNKNGECFHNELVSIITRLKTILVNINAWM